MIKLFKIFILAMVIIVAAPLFSVDTSATQVETYSIPSVSSNICPSCGKKTMEFSFEEIEYSKTVVQKCANTHYEISPHEHRFKTYYDVYMCSICTCIGKNRIKRTMQCAIGENPYALSVLS